MKERFLNNAVGEPTSIGASSTNSIEPEGVTFRFTRFSKKGVEKVFSRKGTRFTRAAT
jgi:hypothetical protein